MNFDDYLCERGDDIDNAIWSFILDISHKKDSDIDWDMSLIGPIADYVVGFLNRKGFEICRPFNTIDPIMEDSIPCYMSRDRCKFCKFNPEVEELDTASEMEKALTCFTNECAVDFTETEYGEEQAWIYLSDDTSIEVCHETNGLDKEYYFYSVRRHCSDEDFDNDVYHCTMGIIDQAMFDTMEEASEYVKLLIEKYN